MSAEEVGWCEIGRGELLVFCGFRLIEELVMAWSREGGASLAEVLSCDVVVIEIMLLLSGRQKSSSSILK